MVASTTSGACPRSSSGDEAVFVRLMDRAPWRPIRPSRRDTIERVVDLLDSWPDLNEFKHTSIKR